jgi:signal transduction histidine kinase/CheY-like chemotaxis protein/HPt (histidine-containing phosphotransfer) domain-containing protein
MRNNRKTLSLTLTATFILMALLVTYTTGLMYQSSYSHTYEIANDKAAAVTADIENYLETARSVLWVAADTVDHMVAKGATYEEIVEYITRESANTASQFDDSYTGLYGYINGRYVDGVGWVPPADYDPTARDWYKDAKAAGGEPLVVNPYVDAQTGNVIISVCKALSNTDDVLGLDLTLSGVQETVEGINISGNGYGCILNYDGTVIAHKDANEKGKNYSEEPDKKEFFEKVMSTDKSDFEMVIDGKKCTVFVDEVLHQWHLVIVVEKSALLKNTWRVLAVSAFTGLLVFALISVFYIMGYRHESKVTKRMEEMKANEQKREYEAKLLMLEKKAADSANKAKSDFLADMSHEIRTPINAVLGMNEMILRESKDDQILEYSSNIKSAGNTLLSIINNILDFSKIEDGKMTLVPVEFDVSELINNLVNTISERARLKGLEFNVEVDESIPSRLYGDDVRISQIVMNLLTNAVKYTESGSVTLRVKNNGITGDDAKIRFDVIDTGIGIKDEDLNKLFESFKRIEEKRNRHIEGTGLGISIVCKLLAMMNSKLDVESQYAIGSTFGFDLKLRVVDAQPVGKFDGKRKSVSSHGEEVHLYAPEAKILVTDDNNMNLKVAENFLKIFGIVPVTCSSGAETIELMKKNRFDIVFLDHMMPQMDGIETLKVLKDDGLINGAVVIALTANAVVGAEKQYLSAGFDGYLSKPITLQELEKALKKYLPSEAVGDKAPEAEEKKSTVSLDKLRELGLNVDAGLMYTCNDEDFYLELLSDYAKSAPDKCSELSSFLENNDLKNYEILAHSLKSSSKTIGADDLSAQAKALEEASRDQNTDFVMANHDAFVESFRELSAKILG